MKMKNIKLKLLMLTSVVSLVACSFGPVKQRPTVSYMIYDTATTESVPVCNNTYHSKKVIYISPMRTNVPYDTTKMFYSSSKYELNTYSYSQWAALPSDLLTQAVTKKILMTCSFRNIATSLAIADANYRLVSMLVSLRQDVNQDDNTASVHMVIASELIDLDNNKVISSSIFNQRVPSSVGPAGLVDGVNKLTNNYDAELIAWLQQNT